MRILQGILAMCSNSIVIISMLKYSFLRSSSNFLVASLSLSDFLHGVGVSVLLPLRESMFVPGQHSYMYLCYASQTTETISIFVQFCMFSLLSVERFRTLKANLGSGETFASRTVIVLISFIWGIMILWLIFSAVVIGNATPQSQCNPMEYFPEYYLMFSSALIVINTFVTFIYYCRIARLIMKSTNIVFGQVMNMAQIQKRKTELRITKMIGMVVGVFFCTYLPTVILTAFVLKDVKSDFLQYIYHAAIFVMDINFWINPVIFAWRDKKFRKAFQMLFKSAGCTRCQTESVHPIPNPHLQPPNAIAMIPVG